MSAAPIAAIAQTVQLSLAPAFMLNGIAGILSVLAGRLSRVIDRARYLEELHTVHTGEVHDRHVAELRMLARRMSILNVSLFSGVSCAVMNCLVVVELFLSGLAQLQLGHLVDGSFILAMLFLIAALLSFLVDVRASLGTIRIRPELLD